MLPGASYSDHYPLKPILTLVPAVRARDAVDQKKYFLLVKRVMDIVFSFLFILVIMSWLLPVLSVLIRLDSPGPVFFRQRRVGRAGKSFNCLKFRTMVRNVYADQKQCEEQDRRITRIGRFLRKTNIDEFPQFFHVFAGSMSLIGPRPHMYADCHHFSLLIPGYKTRNMVKPGLTGLAQVKGYFGHTATRDSILLRFYWDKYYINNMNWWMDCRIFLVTIRQRILAIGALLFHRTPSFANNITLQQDQHV